MFVNISGFAVLLAISASATAHSPALVAGLALINSAGMFAVLL
jgi:hypothetical protein